MEPISPQVGPELEPSAKPPFEEIYREFLPRIYGYVRAQLGSAGEAEDVTAQVFLKAFEAYPRYRPQAQSPGAWLFTIARNAALDRHRRSRSRERTLVALRSLPQTVEDPELLVEAGIRHERLLEAIRAMPDRQREVISLRHASDLQFREIGAVMGCSEDAAKMLYHRALRALRERLPAEEV